MTTTSSSPVDGGAGAARSGGGRIIQKQRSPSEGTDSGGSRETWISTNKILNSSLCGRRTNSRNPNFDYDETKLLISLWGDPQVQKTLITTHKKHPVIAELARKMREQGYSRSTEEINTRIKNLKCFYNRIKKDMAAGIINQTTWRHYAEMDEIISRPVFGNSHRIHQMQQQKGQPQQSHSVGAAAADGKGRKPMTSDEGEEDEDELAIDQFPVKLEVMSEDDDEATEIRAEDLLTIDAKFPEENIASASGGGGGKSTGGKSTNGRATNEKRNGKQTDDDDDDEDDDDDDDDEEDDDEGSDFDVENEFNDGLDEFLLKAQKNKTASGSATGKTVFGLPGAVATSKPPSSSGLIIESISSANGTTICAASSSAPTPGPVPVPGKISVVPTNLLLKQPTVSTSINKPIQIYTPPTVSLASSTMLSSVAANKMATVGKVLPAGSVATGVGAPGSTGVTPVKLLLVNTVGKDGTTQQILTPASEVPNMSQLISTPNFNHPAKIPITLPAKTPIVSIPAVNVPPKVAEMPKAATGGGPAGACKSDQSAGFKTLLTQLVSIQRENLAINQQRLAMEKERLEFEKQFGGSFVTMVRNMSSFFSGMLQFQRKELNGVGGGVGGGVGDKQQKTDTTHTALLKKSDEDKQNEEKDPLAPTATDVAATESNDSSQSASPTPSSSTPATDPLLLTPTGNKRRSSSDATVEKLPAQTPSKEPAESVPDAPVANATNDPPENSATSDVSLPKKRRMMTRNSSQLSQVPQPRQSSTEEELKTEVISDNDER